ncbi:MAG: NAD(P)/FAD-dependent oxidoreductase [Nitrospirota bacterium]|jgi:flavin-dependent dehydrogenase
MDADPYVLEDGSRIAVIGGGPTGSFFSIFALKMAKMLDKQISVTIFEPKDFTRDGPIGCNHCGGIISELLVQTLAIEGINLPDSVVRKGINSYRLHTEKGSVHIATPALEKTIATVYRGGGPKGIIGRGKESFDRFLLMEAVREGAEHRPLKVDRVELREGRPVLFSKDREVLDADLVVGAFGVNSRSAEMFEPLGFGYRSPKTVKTAIAEIALSEDVMAEYFGDSIQLFLLPMKNIKFAAMIPKGTYVTLCILGKGMDAKTVERFLEHPVVRRVLPETIPYKVGCRCVPLMNVRAPKRPFTDRVVLCGDAGSTRLFKDGLGAAYIMGKAAARTAVFRGVSKEHFNSDYHRVYRSIITDNGFGRLLYMATDLYRNYGTLTSLMLDVVRAEQESPEKAKHLSSILWDMFTGNERYKNVFFRTLSPGLNVDQAGALAKILVGRGRHGGR